MLEIQYIDKNICCMTFPSKHLKGNLLLRLTIPLHGQSCAGNSPYSLSRMTHILFHSQLMFSLHLLWLNLGPAGISTSHCQDSSLQPSLCEQSWTEQATGWRYGNDSLALSWRSLRSITLTLTLQSKVAREIARSVAHCIGSKPSNIQRHNPHLSLLIQLGLRA